MVYFRKRLGKDIITEVNELIASPKQSSDDSDNDDTPLSSGCLDSKQASLKSDRSNTKSCGRLILDATYTLTDM